MPRLLLTDNLISLPDSDYEVQQIDLMLVKAICDGYASIDSMDVALTYPYTPGIISGLLEKDLPSSNSDSKELPVPEKVILFNTYYVSEDDYRYSFTLFTQRLTTTIETIKLENAIALLQSLQPALNQSWDMNYKSKIICGLKNAIVWLLSAKKPSQPIFTLQDCGFMLDAINGVRTVPERLLANLIGHSEFADMPLGLADKLASLDSEQVRDLFVKLYNFWGDGSYHIPDTTRRLKEVGLI